MTQKPVILLAFANERRKEAEYLRNLPKELAGIKKALGPLETKEDLEVVVLTNATFEQIVDALQDRRYRDRIAVFHYGGHANSYHFLFETLDGQAVETAGQNFLRILSRPSLKLVFLNGCATKSHARALNDAGIPLVIATSQSISDRVATSIAIRFYKGLAQAIHVEKAWQDAEETVMATYGQNDDRGIGFYRDQRRTDLSPWSLYIRPGSEDLRFWDLSQAAGNPLLGLPDIPEEYYLHLPPKPFLSLQHFEQKHAALFFGRGREIRALYNKIQSIFPVILYYGQSGVGKSSLLDAGLLPRLDQHYTTTYLRRDQTTGLTGALISTLLPNAKDDAPNAEAFYDRWLAQERETGKPLLIILDQVEEAITRPMTQTSPDAELRELFELIAHGFKQKDKRPQGKFILAYRKEYHPEIKAAAAYFGIPAAELFLRPITRSGIMEAVQGVAQHRWLQDKYNLTIANGEKDQAGLPAVIADDLLEDEKSSVAPILQIWLTEMWDQEMKTRPETPRFTLEAYQKVKRRGLLLSNFLNEKFQDLRQWNAEVVDSGLLLDLLFYFTTPYHTAEQRSLQELNERYAHLPFDLNPLLDEIKKTYLLVDVRQTANQRALRLAHDILAPLIRYENEQSGKPGQMAARILTGKIQEKNLAKKDPEWKKQEITLDDQSLDIVENGKMGMRDWTDVEKELVEKSRSAKKERLRLKKRNQRIIRFSATGLVLLGVLTMTFFLQSAKDKRWAESNVIASMALDDLAANPTESFNKAREAWQMASSNNFAYSALLESHYEQLYDYDGQTYSVPFYQDILRAEDWVYTAEYSNDGKYVAAGLADGTIRVFQADGILVDSISLRKENDRSLVRAVRFSKDDAQMLCAIDNNLFVLDFDGKKLTKRYEQEYPGDIRSVDLSNDKGEQYALFSCRDQAYLWHWQQDTSAQPLTPPLFDETLYDAVFAYDGRYIATGGTNKVIRLFDWEGRLIDSIPCNDTINSLAFNPAYTSADNGLVCLAAGLADQDILAWPSLNSKTPLRFTGHTDIVYKIAFSNNGRYLGAASRDKTTRLWSLASNASILTLRGHRQEVYEVLFSPDDQQIVTGSLDGTLKKWRLTGHPIPAFTLHQDQIKSLDISPDGQYLLSSSDDNAAVVWNLADRSVYRKTEPCVFLVKALFGIEESNIIIACDDQLKRWDFLNDSLHLIPIQVSENFISDITLSNDKKQLAVSYDREIHIRNTSNLQSVVDTLMGHKNSIVSVSFSPAGEKLMSTSWDEQVIVWNLNNTNAYSSLGIGSIGNSAVFKPNGQQLIVGTDAAEILFITEDEQITARMNQHTGTVSRLSLGPRGHYFASVSYDKKVGLWSSSGELISLFEHTSEESPTAVQFSHDGTHLLIGYENGKILLLPIDPNQLTGANNL